MSLIEDRGPGGFDLGATALLFQRGASVGRFTVQNLAAGGALLTGAHEVRRSAPLRMVVEMPGGVSFTVGGHVTRQARTGNLVALRVAFRHLDVASEDRIQEAIMEDLALRDRLSHPAVLIMELARSEREALEARVRACGRRVRSASTPLAALQILDDPKEHIDTLLARDSQRALELLAMVASSYAGVRPVLYVDDPRADPALPAARVQRCAPAQLAAMLGAS